MNFYPRNDIEIWQKHKRKLQTLGKRKWESSLHGGIQQKTASEAPVQERECEYPSVIHLSTGDRCKPGHRRAPWPSQSLDLTWEAIRRLRRYGTRKHTKCFPRTGCGHHSQSQLITSWVECYDLAVAASAGIRKPQASDWNIVSWMGEEPPQPEPRNEYSVDSSHG